MKRAGNFAIAALISIISMSVLAQSPTQRDSANLARFQHYAASPQDSMHYFRTDGFQYLGKNAKGEDAVALWTGVNQVYLLTLQSPCINLGYAGGLTLTSTSGNVNARMDSVRYGGNRECRIQTIQKVDYKALRAAEKGDQPAAGAQPSAGG